MTFFYDLNKKLNSIESAPETKQLNERDMGKHNNGTTGFKALAKKAGGGEKGAKIAGAQLAKMRAAGQVEEDMSRAAKGYEKYGKEGMEALAKAGREGRALDPIRDKYNKYDEGAYQAGPNKSQIPAVNRPGNKVTLQDLDKERTQSPTSPEGLKRAQQRLGQQHPLKEKMSPAIDRKPEQKTTEAAKWRDPKYKDKLYTQEPGDSDDYDSIDYGYDTPERPENDPGQKRRMGGVGSEFDRTDPLAKGQGIGRSGIEHNINTAGKRKGLPSRDQISSLKGSIKDAHGKHVEPNLPEAGAPMTAKQKSFAKLAPPTDKITFADKIAGAKKEVDEMLGDVAAEAMKNALGKGKKVVADEGEDNSPFTAHKRPRDNTPKVGDVEHGAKHDIKHTATGRKVTRRADDQGISIGSETDDEGNQKAPRGRGRPKGPAKGTERVTGKAIKHKGEREKKGSAGSVSDAGKALQGFMIGNKPSKPVGKVSVSHKMKEGDVGPMEEDSSELKAAMALLKKAGYKVSKSVDEESTTTRDDRAEKAGKKVAKDIEYDEKKKDGIHGKKRDGEDDKAEKAGKKVAKDIEYDEKKSKKKEKTQEAGGSGTPTASSGFSYGQGIYDSLNRDVENAINESMQQLSESMSVNMSDSTEGGKSLTITATDDDALKLATLLKSAGLGNGEMTGDAHGHDEGCATCGQAECGCDDEQEIEIDEVSMNAPDYPTNTEEGNALEYSGGLNGPKSTGQSTVPVLASQDDRQHSYAEAEEDALHRMMEMAGIKKVKEDDVEEGNKFTAGLADDDIKVGEKIPGTNAVKKKDIDEGILASTRALWKKYQG